jgi:hypothetical protein
MANHIENFYNPSRRHSPIGYLTPNEHEPVRANPNDWPGRTVQGPALAGRGAASGPLPSLLPFGPSEPATASYSTCCSVSSGVRLNAPTASLKPPFGPSGRADSPGQSRVKPKTRSSASSGTWGAGSRRLAAGVAQISPESKEICHPAKIVRTRKIASRRCRSSGSRRRP